MNSRVICIVSCFVLLFLAGQQVMGQDSESPSKQEVILETVDRTPVVSGALAPPDFPKFTSYPTSRVKPQLIETGQPEEDKMLHELRLQHWYFIFDQQAYQQRYGELPQTLPYGMSPKEYAADPPADAFSEDLDKYFETGELPADASE